MSTPLIAGIYRRVSDGRRQDAANQDADTARICAARGWHPEFYTDEISGVKYRPRWAQLLEDARTGRIQAVVFWALDRIGRTRFEIAHDLHELSRWNVAIVSCKDSILDLPRLGEANPMAAMVREQTIAWWAFFAQAERARLIERVRAGLDRARDRGVTLGRPSILSPAAKARGIELRRLGLGWGSICVALRDEGLLIEGSRSGVKSALLSVYRKTAADSAVEPEASRG